MIAELDDTEYMTVPEVARLLRLNKSTVYNFVKHGRLPATRTGDAIRISRRDLKEYLHRNTTGKPSPV